MPGSVLEPVYFTVNVERSVSSLESFRIITHGVLHTIEADLIIVNATRLGGRKHQYKTIKRGMVIPGIDLRLIVIHLHFTRVII